MLKGLIWFDDMELFNKCELEARRTGLICAADYIATQVENYLEKIDTKYAPKIIISKKTGEEKTKKYFKNNIDVWLALKERSTKENITVSALMERICRDILVIKPIIAEQLPATQTIEPIKVDKGFTIVAPWDKSK
jgi:hypothetical protein